MLKYSQTGVLKIRFCAQQLVQHSTAAYWVDDSTKQFHLDNLERSFDELEKLIILMKDQSNEKTQILLEEYEGELQ